MPIKSAIQTGNLFKLNLNKTQGCFTTPLGQKN